jgi:hypothetical protein
MTDLSITDEKRDKVLEAQWNAVDILAGRTASVSQDVARWRLEEAIALLQSLQPAAPAGQMEPSAYRVWARGGKFTRGLYENPTPKDFELWKADGDTVEPLYTAVSHPQAESLPAGGEAEPVSTQGLREMLDLINETDAARWEVGFRNIVAILHGSRHKFEISDVVEDVRRLAAQGATASVPSQPADTHVHSGGEA